MLMTLLGQKVQIVDAMTDWKEAIRYSAEPLLANDSIEDRYIDAMIAMCEQLDAYIVLADLFAMPHASPGSGAKKMDVALTIVKEPVDFMGKPVQVLLTLAAVDSNSHLELLQQVATTMGDPEKIAQLIAAKDTDSILQILAE